MLALLRTAAILAMAGGAIVLGLMFRPVGSPPAPIELTGDVNRGAYLARASGCIACHTDIAGGAAPLAGGAPLKTPFGAFYPPNLTTDPDLGIGDWTVEDFAKAVRQGISPTGEPYFPTFPYPFYANFSDQEIADLWAAFQTVPAVPEPSPEHEAPFPVNQRWALKLWRAMFLTRPETDPVDGRSAAWNRGRELVRGAAHCGACHTPRNLAGARSRGATFSGNEDLPGGDNAPSLRPADLRARSWTVENLAFALRTGLMPDGDSFGGSMGEVVQGGTAFLSDADLTAMATYVLDAE
ncbi:c-type cytochrome [Aliiruegeria lutimaris]|uniref:Cytochrome c, mono-and diheme variants n=1 Tax=Aliiruegeria lutimaris TaxID=571298 RepID=A0A1G8KMM4_9RHOB|nr:cytochrome c [Aliiruegeria lutimaris]SDI44647.1 Cytochrome c, mono-and diheme variants [Aliiruegeria lutimaris]